MKGVYCIVMDLARHAEMRVGSLGVVRFSPGTYAYVGSALGGIEQRIGRHKSTNKKRRWHIDYLLDKAEIVATIAIPAMNDEAECRLAGMLAKSHVVSCPVKGFGSSDCQCDSHLFYFEGVEPSDALEEMTMLLSTWIACIP